MARNKMLEYALKYASMGLAVFPLRYKDKSPVIKGGFKNATTDRKQIGEWWGEYPHANIGIATGTLSGNIIVIDLDVDDDKGMNGYDTLRDWERDNGSLPDTACSITGRGGNHLFFKSNKIVKSRTNLYDGVDIRAEGGYIVAPPSIHRNGNLYEWEQDIEDYGISEADETVFKFLENGSQKEQEYFHVGDTIADGSRNATLYKMACSMQSKGYDDETIRTAVHLENKKKCSTPLDDDELNKTIDSALSQTKGNIVPQHNPESKQFITLEMSKPDSNGNQKPIQSIKNICTVLREDELLSGKIRFNSLAYSPYVCGQLPWLDVPEYREWNDTDDSNVIAYIEDNYGLKSETKIMHALNIIMQENVFNPVVTHFKTLPKWDGEKHIENLLPDYLGVEKNEYSIECMKLFMLGAIHRAYKPGCKFDYMPVIVGDQGIGKSTFLKVLALNDSWYDDNFNTVEGEKAVERLRGVWIVEMAELLAVKRQREIEGIKAFITSTIDNYRPPYGRRTVQRPRACVFAGTTNNIHFLTDTTGNRRYLPILARSKFVKKSLFENEDDVQNEFRQAWAEALNIYHNDKPELIMPKHLRNNIVEIQQNFTEEDVRVGVIQGWLNKCGLKRVCVMQIWEKALDLSDKPTRRESNEIHDIMRNSIDGWNNIGRQRTSDYGNQICYEKMSFDPNNDAKPQDEIEDVPF